MHLKKAKLAADVDPEKVAALTPGFTGADLANLVNEAALLATRRGADHVTMADFTNAVERIVAGLEKRNRLLNPKEREIVAYHEMGHALVALSLPGSDPVHKVSIIPRGVGALGYTIQRPTEDRFLMTREELESKMAVLLGGRAAELTVFGHLSTGAADDLRRVTDIARSMVTRYGMSEQLGSVAYDRDPRTYPDRTGSAFCPRASRITPRRRLPPSTRRFAPSCKVRWTAPSPFCASGASCSSAAPAGCSKRKPWTKKSSPISSGRRRVRPPELPRNSAISRASIPLPARSASSAEAPPRHSPDTARD